MKKTRILNPRDGFLVIYFGLLACLAYVRLHQAYLIHHSWIMGDWLINYAAGFVRRGFVGSALFMLSRALGLPLGVLTYHFIFAVYGLFLFYSARLLRRQPSLLPYAFVLTAPFLFLFPVYDAQGAYRKEIALLALLAWLVDTAQRHPARVAQTTLTAWAVVPLLLLSHEGLLAWTPFLLVPAVRLHKHWTVRQQRALLLLIALSVLVWGATLYYRGDGTQAERIQRALYQAGYAPISNEERESTLVWWWRLPLASILRYQAQRLRNGVQIAQILVFPLLAAPAFIPLAPRMRWLCQTRAVCKLIGLSAFLTLGLMVVAVDWGRMLYTFSMALVLLTLLDVRPIPLRFRSHGWRALYLGTAVLYGLSWKWHHMFGAFSCTPACWQEIIQYYLRACHNLLLKF
ncbi:MAG: hypothetical protein GXO54_01560 [Chloroflexi bacterium]|nr:hypothetical protein [Chloroflexota bacterium]